MRKVVNGEIPLQECIGLLRRMFKEHKFLTVSIRPGKDRTVLQNANLHAWTEQVSREVGEYTAGYIKALWKYHYGVPILRADGYQVKWQGEIRDYGELFDRIIMPLSYEKRIEAMEIMPCTSLMNTKQLSRMMEQIQAEYAARITLEFGGKKYV